MRHERAIHERIAGANKITRVDARMGRIRHLVLFLSADRFAVGILGLNVNDPLAALAFADADLAADFRHDGRIARFASLEDFRDPRQAARDVLRAANFSRRLGQERAGDNVFAVPNFQVRALGNVLGV